VTLSEELPLRIEWVDERAVVERLMPQVRQMVDDGLITLERVDVVQYAPGRRPDPLGSPVAEAMRTEVTSARPETAVEEIVTLLLRRGHRCVAVLDGERRVVGLITDGDLLRRAGISARLDLQEALSGEQVRQQLAALQALGQTAGEIMSRPVVTVDATDSLGTAMERMVAQGLKRLPVLDGDGRLAGWISRVDVLRTLAYHQLPSMDRPAAAAGSSIAELMYSEVAAAGAEADLEAILRIMEEGPYRRVVVVDGDERPLGIITDGDLLRRSRERESPGLAARLRSLITGKREDVGFLGGGERAVELMSAPAIVIAREGSLDEALGLMLTYGIKRLPVVDGDGRLVGLLGRGRLLRGLLAG
jgi:CBS domain-containing protein